jgi:hypothetical protein
MSKGKGGYDIKPKVGLMHGTVKWFWTRRRQGGRFDSTGEAIKAAHRMNKALKKLKGK